MFTSTRNLRGFSLSPNLRDFSLSAIAEVKASILTPIDLLSGIPFPFDLIQVSGRMDLNVKCAIARNRAALDEFKTRHTKSSAMINALNITNKDKLTLKDALLHSIVQAQVFRLGRCGECVYLFIYRLLNMLKLATTTDIPSFFITLITVSFVKDNKCPNHAFAILSSCDFVNILIDNKMFFPSDDNRIIMINNKPHGNAIDMMKNFHRALSHSNSILVDPYLGVAYNISKGIDQTIGKYYYYYSRYDYSATFDLAFPYTYKADTSKESRELYSEIDNFKGSNGLIEKSKKKLYAQFPSARQSRPSVFSSQHPYGPWKDSLLQKGSLLQSL